MRCLAREPMFATAMWIEWTKPAAARMPRPVYRACAVAARSGGALAQGVKLFWTVVLQMLPEQSGLVCPGLYALMFTK